VALLHLTGHLEVEVEVLVIGQWVQKVDQTLPFKVVMEEQEHILQNM
jgi:hypothetical protein